MNNERKEGGKATLETLAERLKGIEFAVSELTALMGVHTSRQSGRLGTYLFPFPFPLLVGYAEIGRFIRKSASTVRRYKRSMGFPAYRFGRHIVSHERLILDWLIVVEKQRRGLT